MTCRTMLQLFAVASFVAAIGYGVEPGDSQHGVADDRTTPVADRQRVTTNELDGTDSRRLRLREGVKLVNQIGELREAGGRIAFYPDGEAHSLQLLENLALERVSRDLDQAHLKWSVTGVVTEYRGGNYLLLHRAVLKARVPSAAGSRS